jgi:hypothetical protein
MRGGRMKNAVGRSIVAGACLGLLTAGGYLALQADASVTAAAPTEVSVVAADAAANYTSDQVYVAGVTGFLHRYGTTTSPVLWTRYADGVTTAIPELAKVSPAMLTPAGGDVVTTASTVPGHSVSGELTVLDLSTMVWQQLPHPMLGDGVYVGYYGDAMVVQTGTAKLGLRRFAADGTYTTTPVTGIPADATAVTSTKVGDATAVVLHLVTGGESHYALLDLTTAAVTVLPVQPISVRVVLLSADRVGFFGGPNGGVVVRSYARNAPTDEPQVVSLPDGVAQWRVALAGTHVLASVGGSASAPVIDYSAGGGTVVPLVQQGQGVVQGTDGVLLVGGSGPADWSVRRMTADGQVAAVLPLTGPLTNAGLTISQGLLRHVEAQQLPGDPATRYLLFNHRLAAGTDGIDPILNGGTLTGALPCADAVACTRTVDGTGYGTTYLTAGPTATTSVLKTQIAVNTGTPSVNLPSAPGAIVDASLGYVVVNGSNPAKQYVFRPGSGVAPVAGPVIAAALWFDTLWTSPKSGYLQAKNLDTGKSATALPTGAPCVATELQATGRYVYWSCGANGPAGVYDQTRKVSVPVPAGQSLLGDGYLVQHQSDSGDLVRYDLADGTAATVATFARGALADDRGITWAVDRFGGDIAYVDAADAVHLVDPGVAPTAPAAGFVNTSTDGWIGFGPYGTWTVSYGLSRPVVAWTLTVTQVSTGKVVATRTGGPNRVTIFTSWDGYLTNKKKASSGHYRFTTTVTPTAGAAPVTIDSGLLVVEGGIPNLHSYESDGQPSILGVKSNAEGHWLDTTSGAALHDNGWTEDWPWGSASSQVNAIVPFGDINNDGMNDLIARSGTGVLRAYLGIGQAYFGGAKTVTIGSGWNQYNAILTSGDLTGDGIADLLARDKNGKIWRYNGTGRKSFAARVALAGTYKSYTRVIGPGDINGDGRADLLVTNGVGDLYSAYGTGKGTFGALHKVSSGWKGYSVVISAGDLNEDNHPDLLARDSAGVLWRYLGTGKGGFAARQKVGTGYQKYTHLF